MAHLKNNSAYVPDVKLTLTLRRIENSFNTPLTRSKSAPQVYTFLYIYF